MKKRLLCLGLLAAALQLFATGCHPVARWRANHPCGRCVKCPGLHPIQTRRMMLGEAHSPAVTDPPCHGCNGNGQPGVPVSFGHGPSDVVPITNPPGYPNIGYPKPIVPGPSVVPEYALPNPMPVPKGGNP
jgi:hypothetical protein